MLNASQQDNPDYCKYVLFAFYGFENGIPWALESLIGFLEGRGFFSGTWVFMTVIFLVLCELVSSAVFMLFSYFKYLDNFGEQF